jgi:hypothetical protein
LILQFFSSPFFAEHSTFCVLCYVSTLNFLSFSVFSSFSLFLLCMLREELIGSQEASIYLYPDIIIKKYIENESEKNKFFFFANWNSLKFVIKYLVFVEERFGPSEWSNNKKYLTNNTRSEEDVNFFEYKTNCRNIFFPSSPWLFFCNEQTTNDDDEIVLVFRVHAFPYHAMYYNSSTLHIALLNFTKKNFPLHFILLLTSLQMLLINILKASQECSLLVCF